MTANTRYVVVTPVRDEAQHVGKTISSMVSQTVLPEEWVIVDDGSTDGTGRIIDEHASRISWLRTVHRADRGRRQAGGGVVEAFYEGYRSVMTHEWDFVVKLDGDLSFAPEYFERCFTRFLANPKLGIGGGVILSVVNGRMRLEGTRDPPFHVRGATKIYRRECWEAIGSLVRAPGWDTLDEIKANSLGWQTCSFPEIKLVQHRLTGDAEGQWRNWVKNGRANYLAGYHPFFMACKCVKRLAERPLLVASLGLAWGYLSGCLRRTPRAADPALVRYIRRQQMDRLLLRKSLWR